MLTNRIFNDTSVIDYDIMNVELAKAIANYKMWESKILPVAFVTLFEYLELLERLSILISESKVSRIESNRQVPSLTYLAAAVSDFFVPLEEMSEHKIQSRDHETLSIVLKPAPKKLGFIKSEWNPSTLCISFKVITASITVS